MNTPNKLTLLRMILVPVFMILLLWRFPGHYLLSLLVFIGASLTDLFDGKIARKQNIVTNFGKFLDPIADKMLTTAAFLGFMVLGFGYGTVWITLIILLREFLVSSIRMITAGSGKVIAADIWGKVKTVFQMTAIIMTLVFACAKNAFNFAFEGAVWLSIVFLIMDILSNIALWGSAVLTVISGVNYLWKNREFIDPSK